MARLCATVVRGHLPGEGGFVFGAAVDGIGAAAGVGDVFGAAVDVGGGELGDSSFTGTSVATVLCVCLVVYSHRTRTE